MRIVICKEDVQGEEGLILKAGEVVLFIGEIENMNGHSVVVNKAGKVIWGYHTDHFREAIDDEI